MTFAVPGSLSTTEFWVFVVVSLAIVTVGYLLSRGLAKAGSRPRKRDKV